VDGEGTKEARAPGDSGASDSALRRALTWLALLAIGALALAIRSRSFGFVFTGAGEVILRSDDSQYHARRALFSLVNFPAVLTRDPYLNFPDGARVPWPPLWDFTLAAVARLTGGGADGLERVLAWAAAVVASLAVLPVYGAARAVAPRGVALGAAALFAVLPVSVMYSSVGNADHHAAIAFEAAALLACSSLALRREMRGMRLGVVHAGLVAARTALLLTWQGSLLYLAVGEGALVGVAALAGRRDSLVPYGVGALATAALVAPVVASSGLPTSDAYSGTELSRLHVLLLLCAAAVAFGLAMWERRRPAAGWLVRALRLGSLAAPVSGLVLVLSGGGSSLGEGLGYLGKEEPWIARNFENVPIFAGGSPALAHSLFAYLAYLIPLGPLALLWRARERRVREPAVLLAVWATAFGLLALSNARFGNDFSPAAAVSFALVLAEAGHLIGRRGFGRRWLSALVAVALGLALLFPTLSRLAAGTPQVVRSLRGSQTQHYGMATIHRDLYRFAEKVREATPATAGFLDPATEPDYGILCFPSLGYILIRVGERPVTATGFGPYLGGQSVDATLRFYGLESEQKAYTLARRLGVRYVVTSQEGRPRESMLLHRLHVADGAGPEGETALEHFRLVTEGPAWGIPLGFLTGVVRRPSIAPYKLFEVVEGAVLEYRGDPGVEVTAQLKIRTPTGRRFVYRASTAADREGMARLRVPYATLTTAPTRPAGPYTLRIGGTSHRVRVSDAQVRQGAVIAIGE
jgi:dolichyl-diphosphooligosaccharide--protein glycosyltransferase